ncbi:hypothetical protein [Patulibacter defluvii]|uniref:hypothetical protein n=1 Tax=Patulibacter defluvii TaxID=3095358 RepID=UPI002A76523C|nr:hypothetical protein [Patulibacter sp. DM4]
MTTRSVGRLDDALTAAGARFSGTVAVDFGSVGGEVAAATRGVGIAVADGVRTTEWRGAETALREALDDAGVAPPSPGRGVRHDGRWWCPVSRERLLVVDLAAGRPAPAAPTQVSSIDLSDDYATLLVLGPRAAPLLARSGHLDEPLAVGALSVRTGEPRATVLRVAEARYVVQVATARAGDLWSRLVACGQADGVAAVGRDAQRLLVVADARGGR